MLECWCWGVGVFCHLLLLSNPVVHKAWFYAMQHVARLYHMLLGCYMLLGYWVMPYVARLLNIGGLFHMLLRR